MRFGNQIWRRSVAAVLVAAAVGASLLLVEKAPTPAAVDVDSKSIAAATPVLGGLPTQLSAPRLTRPTLGTSSRSALSSALPKLPSADLGNLVTAVPELATPSLPAAAAAPIGTNQIAFLDAIICPILQNLANFLPPIFASIFAPLLAAFGCTPISN